MVVLIRVRLKRVTVAVRQVTVKPKRTRVLDNMQQPQPQPEPRVPIPLTWLESTFDTRSRTEQLLRPELDDGVITQHDFDAAVNFFPSPQRYYSVRHLSFSLKPPPYICFLDCRRHHRHTLHRPLWTAAPPTPTSLPSHRIPRRFCFCGWCPRRYRDSRQRACRFLSHSGQPQLVLSGAGQHPDQVGRKVIVRLAPQFPIPHIKKR